MTVGTTGSLRIEVEGAEAFSKQAPEAFVAFMECTAVVNRRHRESGEIPALHLVLV
jgi:hypothetical protein